jgi:hypothetical protein
MTVESRSAPARFVRDVESDATAPNMLVAATSQNCRRWRDDGIFSALRYFVTVRRAS